jgi:hypothetical protein
MISLAGIRGVTGMGHWSTYRRAAAKPRRNMTPSALILILSPVELERSNITC